MDDKMMVGPCLGLIYLMSENRELELLYLVCLLGIWRDKDTAINRFGNALNC